MNRTYILGLVAAIVMVIAGGFYWYDYHNHSAGASYIVNTSTSDPALVAAQAQFAKDSAIAESYSSGKGNLLPILSPSPSSSSTLAPGTPSSKPSPTATQICKEAEHDDTINYPPDVADKITAADVIATAKELAGTQTVTANFKVNLGSLFNQAGLSQYFTTVSLTASDAQIIAALQKLYNPAAIALGNQVFGDLSSGTGITNDSAFGVINGAFHKINDYYGGSSGGIGVLKSSNTSASYTFNYGPSLQGYILSAKVSGSITASIGSVALGLNAGYMWRDNCLSSLATGITGFRGSASPFVNLDVSLTDPKSGKIIKDYKINLGIGDTGNHKLSFQSTFSKSF